ncbi:hypothetical protein V1477_004130 [Vespula maculifrons]|uniref:Uncharacterized protein n=1 Tax=Vespula maculifrons TaxID=7453 RepID=A0ABD2CTC7_VESMC
MLFKIYVSYSKIEIDYAYSEKSFRTQQFPCDENWTIDIICVGIICFESLIDKAEHDAKKFLFSVFVLSTVEYYVERTYRLHWHKVKNIDTFNEVNS